MLAHASKNKGKQNKYLHVPASSFFPSFLRSLDMTMTTPREFMVQFLVCDIQIMDWSSHHMLG